MIIARIRATYQGDAVWRPYEETLWVTNVSVPTTYETPSEFVTLGYSFDDYPTDAVMIGQTVIDDDVYQETASVAACKAVSKSWYFDAANQLWYINLPLDYRMNVVELRGQQINSYSNKTVFQDANGFSYKPYLKTNITISDKADRGVYSKMSFTSNTLKFHNQVGYDGVGEFDYVTTTRVPGADVNILFISDEDVAAGLTTLTEEYTGFVESDKLTRNEYTIKLGDKREQQNQKIPNTYYEAEDFPDMDDDLGDLIPEGYGDITGLEAVCTNDTITIGDVTYKYATDGTVLTKVYVYDKDAESWDEVTPSASSATSCTFTLSSSDGRDSSGNPLKAKVDCTLRSEKNPGDILADMIERYIGFPYTSDYYDLTTWAAESGYLGDVGIVFAKRQEFFKYVELLQNGSTLPFIFRINGAGKYVLYADKIDRAVSDTFQAIENFNDDRDIETDFTQYATDVVIYHSKDQESEDSESVTIDTYKEQTINIFNFENELEFDTLLTNSADAVIRGNAALEDYKTARGKHSVKFRGILSDLHLFSVIEYDSGIDVSEDITRGYAGIRKLKLSYYKKDFENEFTYLEGYDITDIEGSE